MSRAKIKNVCAGTSTIVRHKTQLYPITRTHITPQDRILTDRLQASRPNPDMIMIMIISLLNSFLIVAVTDLKQIDRNFAERRYSPAVSSDVPQIWLTYSEFAALLNCDPAEVRKASIAAGLARRKSRDGETRVKLTQPLADAFLHSVMRQFFKRSMEASSADPRVLREQMGKSFDRAERLAG